MFHLIQKLFSTKESERTVVFLNDDGSKELTSHKFKPRNLWFLSTALIVGLIVFVIFLMMFTPLGKFIPNRQLRESVIAMQQQVEALQDSMRARTMQLQNLRQVLFSGQDSALTATNFVVDDSAEQDFQPVMAEPMRKIEFNLPKNTAAISSLLQGSSAFPSEWPVEGTLTRTYNIESGHLGIDIATQEGTKFHAIANGVVIGINWTLNYGYVLYIQHQDGIVTVYKHLAQVTADIGDLVFQGEVLGRVGDTGIISSGPHLHMEIWINGIAYNPLQYLIKA